VAFIPAGRKRVMSILLTNLRRFPELDEVQVWLNTHKQPDDDEWLLSLPDQWDKIVLYELADDVERRFPKQLNTGYFYAVTQEDDTLYFRFDDDIVFVDDDYFANMVRYRLENPAPPIVYGNIWNNAVCSYLHQQAGHIDRKHGVVERKFCMDPVGWQSGPFAKYIHGVLLDHIEAGTTRELFLPHDPLPEVRFSISNFCFLGARMRDMVPRIPDEEIWLAERYPLRVGQPNVICGDALVSHYSFFSQRSHLDATNILDRYREAAENRLSEMYYTLLGQAQ